VGKRGYKVKKRKVFTTCRKGKGGIRAVDPLILNLGAGWRSKVYVTFRPLCHRERTSLTIEIEDGWAPGPVWTCLGRARHKIHTRTHTHARAASSTYTCSSCPVYVHIFCDRAIPWQWQNVWLAMYR